MIGLVLTAALVSAIALSSSPDPQLATRPVAALDGVLAQQEQRVPANAFVIGDRWVCEYGYRKVEDGCVEIVVPENGILRGYGWVCKDGFRNVEGACVDIGVPRHAHAIGSTWFCDVGYRKVDAACERDGIEIPKNARQVGLMAWVCNNGYVRSRNECVAIDMPDNAIAIGSIWECALGFRRQDGRCVPMPEEETQAVLAELRAVVPGGRNTTAEQLWRLYLVWGRSTTPWVGLLADRWGSAVEGSCRVHRLANGQVRLECVGERVREVREQCFVVMSGNEGRLECNPAGLDRVRSLSELPYCRVVMVDESYGRLVCRRQRGGYR